MVERKDPQRKNESTTGKSEKHFTSVPELTMLTRGSTPATPQPLSSYFSLVFWM